MIYNIDTNKSTIVIVFMLYIPEDGHMCPEHVEGYTVTELHHNTIVRLLGLMTYSLDLCA